MTDDDRSDEPKTERFNMFMSPSEMKAIDDWMWSHRIRSKSEAVRRLCQIGLRLDAGYDDFNRRQIQRYDLVELVEKRMEQLFDTMGLKLSPNGELADGPLTDEQIRLVAFTYSALLSELLEALPKFLAQDADYVENALGTDARYEKPAPFSFFGWLRSLQERLAPKDGSK